MAMRLGAIADDFTGATDLANNLVRSGMRTVQIIGVPSAEELSATDADAVVIALKSRSAPVEQAVEESQRAAISLLDAGATQIYFKYCSTFDSTPLGNIGPVIDALLDTVGADYTVAVPSFPAVGRTVYQGHLFVADRLLNETGMRHHPLTPMDDADIVRVLQKQTMRPVGLVNETMVLAGPDAVADAVKRLHHAEGVRVAVVDTVSDEDLYTLGSAFSDLPLVTGGSGLGLGLAASWSFTSSREAERLPVAFGAQVVIAGSASRATQGQVDAFIQTGAPSFAIDLEKLAQGVDVVEEVLAATALALGQGPLLVYSTRSAEDVRAFQTRVGVERASELIESTLGQIASAFVERGAGALLVAGGETSGAVVNALGISSLQIGPQIDPGVPWCAAKSNGRLIHIALKSGNFGQPDLFTRAFQTLDWEDWP
ncbi:hypothetical protein ASF40_20590 [Microbacterium sp. Leaf288]|uniref:3-oxo-tetronate kinase n=1 Tax=Microbacterium sp. Leaf288 TaxID=1736323 RepID=UPI0006FFA7CD|nr:3-oxo-tetronate kinase [Microbacterium sp. Leaf288]KQP73239.1 hypothetical protein ASF40_20590 [Microbacterium sp. Leaf288]